MQRVIELENLDDQLEPVDDVADESLNENQQVTKTFQKIKADKDGYIFLPNENKKIKFASFCERKYHIAGTQIYLDSSQVKELEICEQDNNFYHQKQKVVHQAKQISARLFESRMDLNLDNEQIIDLSKLTTKHSIQLKNEPPIRVKAFLRRTYYFKDEENGNELTPIQLKKVIIKNQVPYFNDREIIRGKKPTLPNNADNTQDKGTTQESGEKRTQNPGDAPPLSKRRKVSTINDPIKAEDVDKELFKQNILTQLQKVDELRTQLTQQEERTKTQLTQQNEKIKLAENTSQILASKVEQFQRQCQQLQLQLLTQQQILQAFPKEQILLLEKSLQQKESQIKQLQTQNASLNGELLIKGKTLEQQQSQLKAQIKLQEFTEKQLKEQIETLQQEVSKQQNSTEQWHNYQLEQQNKNFQLTNLQNISIIEEFKNVQQQKYDEENQKLQLQIKEQQLQIESQDKTIKEILARENEQQKQFKTQLLTQKKLIEEQEDDKAKFIDVFQTLTKHQQKLQDQLNEQGNQIVEQQKLQHLETQLQAHQLQMAEQQKFYEQQLEKKLQEEQQKQQLHFQSQLQMLQQQQQQQFQLYHLQMLQLQTTNQQQVQSQYFSGTPVISHAEQQISQSIAQEFQQTQTQTSYTTQHDEQPFIIPSPQSPRHSPRLFQDPLQDDFSLLFPENTNACDFGF